jgi:glycosyltransferase involved in cell wall biosynthesis
MVRVLYIVSTLKRTGPTNVLFNLIKELDRTEFQPVILTLSPEEKDFPSLWKAFKELSIEIHSLHLSRIKGFMIGAKKLKKFVSEQGIQAIHINGIRGDLLVAHQDFRHIKIISTINSNIYDDYTMLYGRWKGTVMSYLHIRSLKGKIAVGCSYFVAKEIKTRYKINLKVIYNGIPKHLYKVVTPENQLIKRTTLGLPLNKKIIIFVGYLIYRKDPLTVLRGFLGSSYVDEMFLLMVGDGPLMDECKALAADYGNIKFLGNQPQTLEFLNAADYYVSSAYSEGLPTSVMEAMGCGLPVILSDIVPHKELLSSLEPWPYIFKVNDDHELSNKLDQIMTDDYHTLSKKCSDVVKNKINSQLMARDYQLLYI